MGLVQVQQEIVAQARQAAAELQRSGAKEVAAILNDAEQKVQAYAVAAEQDYQQLSEKVAQQELSAARFEAKKMLLNQRKAVIDLAFAELADALAGLPERKREDMLGNLLDKSAEEIEVHAVHVNPRDVGIMSKRKGLFVKPSNIIGGLIAENAEGTVRVDHSFDQTLQQLQEQELATIAKELF